MSGNIFFTAVLVVYVSINGYLLARLSMTLAGTGFLRGFAVAVFLLFAASFPAARLFSHWLPGIVCDFLSILGSLYLAPMIYGFFIAVAVDLLRILNYHVAITATPPPYSISRRENTVAAIVAISAAISVAGGVNAMFPAPVYYNAEWKGPGASPIKIAVISDLHLGRFVGPGHLKRVADLVNSRSPDIVLIAGDTIDDAGFLKNKRRKEMTASIFESLKPRLGVWAVPGNHDYYAGIEDSVSFLQSCDVKVLSDEWAAPGWEMLLIGRDDPAGGRYGRERTSLRSIISNAKTTLGPAAEHLPIVVLDHQPHNLEESRSEGVALQISGHTHRGQLFPVNFIVAWLFEKHYGPYKKGDTNYYISSGAGTWGPPIRTIGRPEVVFVSLYAR